DEVIERVQLVQQPAVFVPALAELRAAAHVRDSNRESAVEQRYLVAAEIRIVGIAVGTITDDIQRRAPAAPEAVFAIRERHGDAFAVACRRPESFAGVRRRVIADDRLLLA